MLQVNENLQIVPLNDENDEKQSDAGGSSMASEQDGDQFDEARADPDLKALIKRIQIF